MINEQEIHNILNQIFPNNKNHNNTYYHYIYKNKTYYVPNDNNIKYKKILTMIHKIIEKCNINIPQNELEKIINRSYYINIVGHNIHYSEKWGLFSLEYLIDDIKDYIEKYILFNKLNKESHTTKKETIERDI